MTEGAPRATIGMPVRNGERFIREAIDSLLAQIFADFELLISDNASTDGTEAICRQYAALDGRVRYHRNHFDLGPAENYNRCCRLARGEYFRWAAHDDVCLPTYLERCVAVLDSDPSVVNCHTKTRLIDEQGNPIGDYTFQSSGHLPQPHVRFGRFIGFPHRRHSGYEIFGLMRRSVMKKVPEQGAYAHADRVFLARMNLHGRFVEVDEPLFLARRHAAQSMAKRGDSVRATLARFMGSGPMPPPEWWDPALAGKLTFPDWHLLREYLRSVSKSGAPLDARQRMGAYGYVGLWIVKFWPKLARDVIFAAERLLTRGLGAARRRRGGRAAPAAESGGARPRAVDNAA